MSLEWQLFTNFHLCVSSRRSISELFWKIDVDEVAEKAPKNLMIYCRRVGKVWGNRGAMYDILCSNCLWGNKVCIAGSYMKKCKDLQIGEMRTYTTDVIKVLLHLLADKITNKWLVRIEYGEGRCNRKYPNERNADVGNKHFMER